MRFFLKLGLIICVLLSLVIVSSPLYAMPKYAQTQPTILSMTPTTIGTTTATGKDSYTASVSYVPSGGWVAGDIIVVCGAWINEVDYSYATITVTGLGTSGSTLTVAPRSITAVKTRANCGIWAEVIQTSSADAQTITYTDSVTTAKAITIYVVRGGIDNPIHETGDGNVFYTQKHTSITLPWTTFDDPCMVFCVSAINDELDDPHGSWEVYSDEIYGNEVFSATNGGNDTTNIQCHSVARYFDTAPRVYASDNYHDGTYHVSIQATGFKVTP